MIPFICSAIGLVLGMLIGQWYERRSMRRQSKIRFSKIEFSLPLRRKR